MKALINSAINTRSKKSGEKLASSGGRMAVGAVFRDIGCEIVVVECALALKPLSTRRRTPPASDCSNEYALGDDTGSRKFTLIANPRVLAQKGSEHS